MIYLLTLIWLILNYSYPKMLKKDTPKILIDNYIYLKIIVYHSQLIISPGLKHKVDKYVIQVGNG